MKSISKVIVFFLNSSFFIAICAYVFTLASYKSFGFEPNNTILIIVFFSTLMIYNLARLFPLYLDKKTTLKDNNWIVKNKTYLLSITLFSAFCVAFYSFKLQQVEIIFLSHLGVLSILYSLPLVKPLRDFPYFKIFLIAYVWGAVTVGLPVVSIGFEDFFTAPIILFFIGNITFIFAISIPFDIRDNEVDKKLNLKTLPQKIGVKTMLYISVFLLAISCGISIILNPEHIIFENIIFLLTAGLILKSDSYNSNWYYLGLLDGTIILKSLIYFL